jgi:hypothetical protein
MSYRGSGRVTGIRAPAWFKRFHAKRDREGDELIALLVSPAVHANSEATISWHNGPEHDRMLIASCRFRPLASEQ